MELLIFIGCCYLNYSKAKLANLSGRKWAIYTFIAIFAATLIGTTSFLIYLISNDPHLQTLITEVSQSRNDAEMRTYVQEKMTFLNQLLLFFCGVGGYLFVRYLLDKKIDKESGLI